MWVAAQSACSSQCYQCFDTSQTFPTNLLPAISEFGDVIKFGGTERSLTNVYVGLEQTAYFDPRVTPYSLPYTVDATLKLYTIDGALNATLIAARTLGGLTIAGNGLFNLAFDFTGITVPDEIYYGLSFGNASNVAVDGLRFSLWDYYPNALGGDGLLPVGTDPDTINPGTTSAASRVYGRMAANPSVLVTSDANGLGVNDLGKGFTPAVRFDAVAAGVTSVPEPMSLALVVVGLFAAGVTTARRRST